MKIQQLSLFIENKSGSLNAACRVLSENNINIRTLSLADTQQFGILRLIVREWEKARELFEKAGFVVKVTEVLALRVADHPGGLTEILKVLDERGINVEYMYAFAFGSRGKAVIVFCFEDPDKALQALENGNIDMVNKIDLFK